jgi:hypothetical protein
VKLLRQHGAIILGEFGDPDVVEQHRRVCESGAGLTTLGKTNMTEWASFRHVWYQPDRNIKNFSYDQELDADLIYCSI